MTHPAEVRLAPSSWSRLPRRTARLRLTVLYGGLFLLSGLALVAGTYVLFQQATALRAPKLPSIPHAPAIKPLPNNPPLPTIAKAYGKPLQLQPQGEPAQLPQALSRLAQAQAQLAAQQHRLSLAFAAAGSQPSPLLVSPVPAQDQQRLAQDQHQLTRAADELAQAVHQVAQAGAAQAAQRASDSHQLLADSGIALAAVGLFSLLAGWLIAGRMLRPIRTITDTARRISSTNLHERLALTGPKDELKELGDTLDDLFARLEEAFEAQRHFIAHASHELRTPLTRERTLVQVALGDPATPELWRQTGKELLASNREQETLIDGLLTLASSETELDQRQQADLADICQTVLSRPGLTTNPLGVHLETALRSAPVDGDPRLLERLIANLIDNAVAHNIASGSVHISTDTTNGSATLTVANTGPVVPPTEIDRLFQPFQRLDPRRAVHKNGHGLGLSIVRAIATAHDATITAQPLPQGGISLSVAFPPTDGPSGTASTG